MTRNAHLVLGGSEGIGFSYAKHYAQLGDHLVLVARRQAILDEARVTLLQVGSSSVETISGDLTNVDFRNQLFSNLQPVQNVFIGGPSAPYGTLDEILEKQHDLDLGHACQANLIYPLEALLWSLKKGCLEGGRTILLSSSAARSSLLGTKFFLSGVMRYALDKVIQEMSTLFQKKKRSLEVMYPELVITPLAKRFAFNLANSNSLSEQDVTSILQNHLNFKYILSSDDFVFNELKRME